MLLNLQEIIPLPHDLLELNGCGRGVVTVFARQHCRGHTRHTCRKRNQPFRMFSQELLVDSGFVIEAFGISLRGQTNEIAIAFQIFREQDQMKVCFFSGRCSRSILSAATRDVSFTTDDWIHAPTFHCVVKRDGSKHVAMIGHSARLHAKFFGSLGKGFNLNCAVQQAVISVQMQVCESLIRHSSNEKD